MALQSIVLCHQSSATIPTTSIVLVQHYAVISLQELDEIFLETFLCQQGGCIVVVPIEKFLETGAIRPGSWHRLENSPCVHAHPYNSRQAQHMWSSHQALSQIKSCLISSIKVPNNFCLLICATWARSLGHGKVALATGKVAFTRGCNVYTVHWTAKQNCVAQRQNNLIWEWHDRATMAVTAAALKQTCSIPARSPVT